MNHKPNPRRFILPASLVICNDIFAYVCGFFWGRTQLIKLSPKKTVEGFVGAWMCTMVFGFLVSFSTVTGCPIYMETDSI